MYGGDYNPMTEYRLDIRDELWEEFKGQLSKSQTLNEEIEQMIEERVKETQTNGN